MIGILVWFIVVIAILALCYWALGRLPLPPVAKTVAIFLLAIVAIVLIARLLIGVIGAPPF